MELSFLQEKEIAIAEAHGLSQQQIKVLSNGRLNYLQMAVLRQAMEQGADMKTVKKAARPRLSPEEMAELISHPEQLNRPVKLPVIVLPLILTVLLTGVLYSVWKYAVYLRRERLELRSEEITLLCGDTFQPGQYILRYPQSDDLYLPDSFVAEVPETRIAVYRTASGDQKILRIRIYDKQEPVIRVTETPDPDHCMDGVLSAHDNADGELKAYVSCRVEGDQIIYSVSDSSGNRTEVSRICRKENEEV
ncbi:MAG: hypothetical protein Q4D46_02760 [Erysipelotrichaceae bacterium]|nr:hypothetical protein [Erysipelotrichaceae bacterium]